MSHRSRGWQEEKKGGRKTDFKISVRRKQKKIVTNPSNSNECWQKEKRFFLVEGEEEEKVSKSCNNM